VNRYRIALGLWIAALLIVWEAVCRFGLVHPILLAPPSAIAVAAVRHGGEFLSAFRVTLLEIVVATLVAWVLGIGTGIIGGLMVPVGKVSAPILSALLAIPHIIWYPLFIVWFGIGPGSKIAYGIFNGYFPIALTTIEAIRHLDWRYVKLGRSMGARPSQMFTSIILPLALPGIVSGLRIGTGLVVIGVIVTEMLTSLDGIGYLISYFRTIFEVAPVYFGIILTLLCATAVNALLSFAERRFGRWRDLERGET
jgi:NitT/TauT family transport system permease protein/taurine transport system permease protein